MDPNSLCSKLDKMRKEHEQYLTKFVSREPPKLLLSPSPQEIVGSWGGGGVQGPDRSFLNPPMTTPKKTVQIFNLPTHSLNQNEMSPLEKGLSFCPYNKTDPFHPDLDLHQFIRKLTLKHHFGILDEK